MRRHTVLICLLIWTPVHLQKPNVESITNQPTETIEDSSLEAKVLNKETFTSQMDDVLIHLFGTIFFNH